MVNGFRYIQTNETGFITSYCADPVFVDGVEITIDTKGMTIPEQPTDAIYSLYYNETDKLHWVKVAELPINELTEVELQAAKKDYMIMMMETAVR